MLGILGKFWEFCEILEILEKKYFGWKILEKFVKIFLLEILDF
jgi:hypothetical protein